MSKSTRDPFLSLMPDLIKAANGLRLFGSTRLTRSDRDRIFDQIKGADMDWAIWENPAKPLGHEAILIKGYDKLREFMATISQPTPEDRPRPSSPGI